MHTVRSIILYISGFLVAGSICCFSVYAETEEQDYVSAAAAKLEYMSVCAQKAYANIYLERYPGPGVCGSDLCWNSSSIINSTEDLTEVFRPVCDGFSLSIAVSSGDIRFRCRYQKGQTICFAYRCEEREPAGCKQRWRLERRRAGDSTRGLMKCVDVENRDHCQYFESPDEPICSGGCS